MPIEPRRSRPNARPVESPAPSEPPSKLENVCFWLLAAIVVLAPIPFGSYRAWAWSALSVGVGVLMLLWSISALRRPRTVWIPSRALALPAAVFAIVVVWCLFQASSASPAAWHHPIWLQASDALGTNVAGAISINPEASISGIMRFVAYAGVFFLALQFGRAPSRANAMVWIVALAGLAYALYGLILMFTGTEMILWYPRWAYPGSLTSTFVNRNSYGTYAGLGAVATLSLMNAAFVRSLEKGVRTKAGFIHFINNLTPSLFFLIAAFVVIATALLFSQSRGAFLAAILGIGTFFAMMALRRQQKTGAAIGYVVAFLVAGAVLVSFSGNATLARFADLATQDSGRTAVFALSAHAIAEHPILGWGLGTFRGVFQILRDANFSALTPAYQQAHSSYLELALEAGLPAFALMMSLLAGITGLCVRGVLRRRRRVIYPALGLGVTALVAAHAAIDFSLQIPAITVTYLFLMGAACGQSFNTGPVRLNNGA